MPGIINPYSVQPSAAQDLFEILTGLGYTTNLQFALDAGDSASAATPTSKWISLAPGGHDFFTGTDGSGTDEPAYNGTAGNLSASEFFSFDGGDFLTYDTTNPAAWETIHKDNGVVTAGVWFYNAAGGAQTLLSNASSVSGTGFTLRCNSSNQLSFQVHNGSGEAADNTHGEATINTGAWNFCCVSSDEAVGAEGILWNVNGIAGTDTSTYTSPSSSSADAPLKIGARTNGATFIGSGGRVPMAWLATRAWTAVEMQNFFVATRGRFGI